MVLRRDRDLELLQARQVIGTADERVFDRPALACDRLVAIRRFVGVEHQIHRRIADRVRADAPAVLIQRANRLDERLTLDRLQPSEGAACVVGLSCGAASGPHRSAVDVARCRQCAAVVALADGRLLRQRA